MERSPKKIKLVHVTTVPQTLGFFRGQIGFLKKRGFEIFLISSPGELGRQFSKREGVQFFPIQMTRYINLWGDLIALIQLWIQLRKIKPDVVHAHTPKAGLLGVLSARFAGVPAVYLSIFGLPQMTMRGIRKRLMNMLTRLACSSAHKVWCDSFSMRDFIIQHRLCAKRKAVVMANGSVNGVDAIEIFSPDLYKPDIRKKIRDLLGIPRKSIVLGFSGRIAQDKGTHELAEAWRLLSACRNDLHLILIGNLEDKDPPKPQDIALFKTDPKIHLVGFQKDVPPYLAAIDIFVMPSYREGFGLSNIEASAMGLPIVSTRIPGCIDSVKDGLTGLLVPPRDVEKLVEAIQSYLNDPELRRKHGQAGRQRVLHEFRPEMIWKDLFEGYCALLKKKGIAGGKIAPDLFI